MIRFESDYAEGAHLRILERLAQTNLEQTPGYGLDHYSNNARKLICNLCENQDLDVHFLTGGTQANLIVIVAALRPHQGVIAASTGHITTHESGAIEASGHKVLELPSADGKLSATQVAVYCQRYQDDSMREHLVQPAMVYISHPTENGTTYSHAELQALHDTCHKHGLLLYLDGARLGYGLVGKDNDLTLSHIARCCDAFTIGATKVGALFGEAIVLTHPSLQPSFRSIVKQRGGLLAKGRLLGLQFEALFEDGLYFALSRHAVEMAEQIQNAFALQGFSFRYHSTTNQIFPILPTAVANTLAQQYSFSVWETLENENIVARFCTSWATRPEDVLHLTAQIGKLSAHG